MSLLDLLHGNGHNDNGAHAQDALTYYAVAYLRVSTDGQDENAQRADIERYAAREAITVLEWFRDHALSATGDHENRKEFWRMVNIAKADPRVSEILVWDESRFFRDRLQATIVKADLLTHGVKVIPVKHPYDAGTIDGVILESLHQALAQVEAMKIAERTLAGLMYNCTQRDPKTGWAFHNGGGAAYGYRAEKVQVGTDERGHPKHKEIWVKDDTVDAGRPRWEWVRVVLLDWLAGEGVSNKEIIRRLNQRGVKPYEGGQSWNCSTIHYLCQPEKLLTYAGYYIWNKYRRRNDAGQRRGKKRKPTSEWQSVENAHEPILTMEEAERVLAALRRRPQKPKNKGGAEPRLQSSPFLLSGGLAVCGRCGAPLVGRGGGNSRRVYFCSLADRSGRTMCGKTYALPSDLTHDTIWDLVAQHFPMTDEAIRALTRRVNAELMKDHQHPDTTRKALEKKLRDIERNKERLREAFHKGADAQWVADESKRLREEEDEARRQLAATASKSERPRLVTEADIRRWCEDLKGTMASDNNEMKRQAIRAFVKQVVLYPDEERAVVRFNRREDVLNTIGAEGQSRRIFRHRAFRPYPQQARRGAGDSPC